MRPVISALCAFVASLFQSRWAMQAEGLDHRLGHLISMTTEKMPDSIQRGIEIR